MFELGDKVIVTETDHPYHNAQGKITGFTDIQYPHATVRYFFVDIDIEVISVTAFQIAAAPFSDYNDPTWGDYVLYVIRAARALDQDMAHEGNGYDYEFIDLPPVTNEYDMTR